MRVYLRTFGCRANQYDTERVRHMVLAGGGTVVEDVADADVAVFNSCAVTAAAEADLRQAVRRTAERAPGVRSVIMGCAAALDRGTLRALPTVQEVLPAAELPEIAAALALPPDVVASLPSVQTGARALLRVQEGCDEHCTFCATTQARGANRSRPAAELLAEARGLAERHAEIVLTGIHIGSYGADTGGSLGELLETLATALPATRFRLSSVEATELDDRLVALLRDGGATVAPHLHAPLQSGADRVLRRMGRHWYTAGRYAAAVERLTEARPAFGLGADVIAGFPGETEADHQATLALVERLPFSYLHVFPFSLRPGTPAERLPGRVDGQTVARRARELREAAAAKAASYRARRAGGAADVVVVGREPGAREGITEDYLSVLVTDPAVPRGTRLPCRLEAEEGRLLARPIRSTALPPRHPSPQER